MKKIRLHFIDGHDARKLKSIIWLDSLRRHLDFYVALI